MTSETRTFPDLPSYQLTYQYNLADELTSITNPFTVTVGYGYDKTGRPTFVSKTNLFQIRYPLTCTNQVYEVSAEFYVESNEK
jgi:YD repeat-containing protein